MGQFTDLLRTTRANMIGTPDEAHYWHCQEAADALEAQAQRIAELEAALRNVTEVHEVAYDTPQAMIRYMKSLARAALKQD